MDGPGVGVALGGGGGMRAFACERGRDGEFERIEIKRSESSLTLVVENLGTMGR